MSSKKQPSENSLSSKVTRSAKSLKATPSSQKKPLINQVTTRAKMPDLSPVNVIEQISQMLRKEVHDLERKKAIGE